jgi:hypothetical protein
VKRKFAVVGSRDYPNREAVDHFIEQLEPVHAITIVSGGARGVDRWAVARARERGITTVEIRPNWKKYGRGAGFRCNTEIIRAADDVVAFWTMESRGTFDSIRKATEFKKDVMVIGPDGLLLFAFTQEDYARDAGIVLPKMDIPKGA